MKAKITYKDGNATEDNILSHEIVGNLMKVSFSGRNRFEGKVIYINIDEISQFEVDYE